MHKNNYEEKQIVCYFMYAKKWRQAFKVNLYIVRLYTSVCLCSVTIRLNNVSAWQQSTPNENRLHNHNT